MPDLASRRVSVSVATSDGKFWRDRVSYPVREGGLRGVVLLLRRLSRCFVLSIACASSCSAAGEPLLPREETKP